MGYLQDARKRLDETMEWSYGRNNLSSLTELSLKFQNAAPQGWTISRFANHEDRQLLLLPLYQSWNPTHSQAVNQYWPAEVFGFPTQIDWGRILKEANGIQDASIRAMDYENQKRMIKALKTQLVTIPNIALLLRFLCPEKFAMFSGYLLDGFFPIDWTSLNEEKSTQPDEEGLAKCYLTFCDNLGLIGEDMAAADVEHAIWVIWRRNRQAGGGFIEDKGISQSLLRDYFSDPRVNALRFHARPLLEFMRDPRKDKRDPKRDDPGLPAHLLQLSEIHFPLGSRIAGMFARQSLEQSLQVHAALNAHGVQLPEDTGNYQCLLRIACNFQEKDIRGMPPGFRPQKVSPATEWLERNYSNIDKARKTGNKCAHPNDNVEFEDVRFLIDIAQQLANQPRRKA